MDEFLEFLNKWLVRPVSIVTTFVSLIGFLGVAIALISQAIPSLGLPEIQLDVSRLVPDVATPSLGTLDGRAILLIASATMVLLLGVAIRISGARIGEVVWLIPYAYAIFAGCIAGAARAELNLAQHLADSSAVWGSHEPMWLRHVAWISSGIVAVLFGNLTLDQSEEFWAGPGCAVQGGTLFCVLAAVVIPFFFSPGVAPSPG